MTDEPVLEGRVGPVFHGVDMQMRTVVSAFVGAFLMLVSARPALAQGAHVDFAAGYQFLSFLESGSSNVPTGWGVSFAAGKSDRIKFVADIGGHYQDGESLHTFQGGLEVAGTSKRVVP